MDPYAMDVLMHLVLRCDLMTMRLEEVERVCWAVERACEKVEGVPRWESRCERWVREAEEEVIEEILCVKGYIVETGMAGEPKYKRLRETLMKWL